ncbi:tyrosine-type recombinase/integrase [uncultured Parabacteroides sp.]|uniref:tyrosine-type recombinase/integrase n=1 Tax=uncultured Parabacteroides sp. TaxID=512312 RepID=UPI0026DB875A|nr:tyrosine-type recombinase/integrase [uncultured Parabacteroides sp.]
MKEVKLYPTQKSGRLYVRISYQGVYKDIPTDKYVFQHDIDKSCKWISNKSKNKRELENTIKPIISQCQDVIENLEERSINFTAQLIKDEYYARIGGTVDKTSLIINGINQKINELVNKKRFRNGRCRTSFNTSKIYGTLKNQFISFCQYINRDVNTFSCAQLDNKILQEFFLFLKKHDERKKNKGTAHVLIGKFKSIFREMKNNGNTCINLDLWDNLPAPSKEVSRDLIVLSVFQMYQIINYTPQTTRNGKKANLFLRQLYLDAFAFSYFCNGVAPVDLIYLKRSDIVNGKINPERWKTSGGKKEQRQTVILKPEALKIIEKYSKISKNDFIFPIIDKYDTVEEQEYFEVYFTQNTSLYIKSLCKKLGFPVVSFYGARHAFATHAINAGIDAVRLALMMGTSVDMIKKTYFRYTDEQKELDNQMIMEYQRKQLELELA